MTLRCLWLTGTLLSACGFTAPPSDGPPDPGDDVEPPPTTTADRHCATTDPALRLCIDFDDADTLTGDGSGRHHDAVSTDLSVMQRHDEQAAALGKTTRVTVAETPDLDITDNLTVELWAHPDGKPSGSGSYWLFDNNRQYHASYEADRMFRCGIGSAYVEAELPRLEGAWYHIACTYDRSAESMRIYIDGWLAGCRDYGGAIPTDGDEGFAIGSNRDANDAYSSQFLGGLDNVQVFARTVSGDEICDASGSPLCSDICP